MLTDRYLDGIPEGSRAGKEHGFLQKTQVEQQLSKITQLNEIAKQRGESLAAMALAWTLHNPTVTSTLIGASSVAQLEINLAALNSPRFSDGELVEIDRALKD
jgi:L-glyceraldehyde 3-phosphate reductase